MILGHLIIGTMLGFVAGVSTLIAGWGFGLAFLAYSGVGALSVLVLVALALTRGDGHEPQRVGAVRGTAH